MIINWCCNIFNRSALNNAIFGCSFKGCKSWFNTNELLADHCLTDHDCDHLGCTTKCKNQVALKEHKKDKHGLHCEVTCFGMWQYTFNMVILFNTCVIGQTYQLVRHVDTEAFKCPHCSHTSTTIRLIQRHCKDHVTNSTAKHVANRYHPYSNDQPPDNAQTIVDTPNTGQDQNDMDIDSELFNLIFPLMYAIEFYKMVRLGW